LIAAGNAGAQDATTNATRDNERAAVSQPEYRHEAINRPAVYRRTRPSKLTVYEERIVSYTEPETIYRTVREDRGSWQMQQRRTASGVQAERVWVPHIVETQVPEVIQVERLRIERVPHEMHQELATTVSETVVVHVRRPAERRSQPIQTDVEAARPADQLIQPANLD
jgi:hypothetical protein